MNGVVVSSVKVKCPAMLPLHSIGCDAPGRSLDGWLHSARVWRCARTPDEVSRDCLVQLKGASRPEELIGAFGLSEGTGCFVGDEGSQWFGFMSGAVRWEVVPADDVVATWREVRRERRVPWGWSSLG